MPEPCSPQTLDAFMSDENSVQHPDNTQCVSRSRPVSFYDNYKVALTTQPCVTSAMSVGNLSQTRECSVSFAQQNTNGVNSNNNIVNNNNKNEYAPNCVSSAASAGNVSKIQPPKVTGAVSTGNIGKTSRSDRDKELGKAPSMANCLSTTVPVNLAASQIAGRHTPTRNSLRHSRMIVMHRSGHNPRKVQPLIRHRRLLRFLASMKIILGAILTALSIYWLLLQAPSMLFVDNPYFNGMPILISGICGICLLCCFHKEYPGVQPRFCLRKTKEVSMFIASLSTVACCLACIASVYHLLKIFQLECSSSMFPDSTCTCRTQNYSENNVIFKYENLSCSEFQNIVIILLIFSSICNGLGTFISCWYSYLHWITHFRTPAYISV